MGSSFIEKQRWKGDSWHAQTFEGSRNHPHLFSSSLSSTSYTNDSPWAESAWNKLPITINKSLASISGIVIANQQATPSFSRLLLPCRPYSPHRSPPLLEAPLHLCPPGLTSWTRGAGAAKTPFLVFPEPHSTEESSLLQETSCRSKYFRYKYFS